MINHKDNLFSTQRVLVTPNYFQSLLLGQSPLNCQQVIVPPPKT